jgi:hypothetical protein
MFDIYTDSEFSPCGILAGEACGGVAAGGHVVCIVLGMVALYENGRFWACF